jgi:hypothetical protein
MKNTMIWIGRFLLLAFALLQLLVAATSPMPKALMHLAIGGGILIWQATKLRRYLRNRTASREGSRT